MLGPPPRRAAVRRPARPGTGPRGAPGAPAPAPPTPSGERKDLALAGVDAQDPRHAVDPAALEVGEQPVNPLRAGLERPAYGVADAHRPGRVAAGERCLRLRAVHGRIMTSRTAIKPFIFNGAARTRPGRTPRPRRLPRSWR